MAGHGARTAAPGPVGLARARGQLGERCGCGMPMRSVQDSVGRVRVGCERGCTYRRGAGRFRCRLARVVRCGCMVASYAELERISVRAEARW